MRIEMFEFMLEQAGVIPDIPHIHMVAPKGAHVINPRERIPWYDRHARRFPDYARHPELTRGRQAGLATWVYYNSSQIARSARFVTVRVLAPLAVGYLIHEGVKLWLGETDRTGYREPTNQERIDAYTTNHPGRV